jgi:Tol biopolymer transport system component
VYGRSYLNDLYRKPSNGTGMEELLLHAGINARPEDWSRDGRYIVYAQYVEKTDYDLWLLPQDGDRKPVLYLGTQFDEQGGQFSPDGRWMAYRSNESGQRQIYVQTVPASGAKWRISAEGGKEPRWRRDGKEIFYIGGDQKLTAVSVKMGGTPSAPSFEAGAPQPLFEVYSSDDAFTTYTYQPAADGQRFLVLARVGGGASSAPITVILNWQAGARK